MTSASQRRSPWAVLADVACVVVFVLVGRRSHHEDAGVSGFLQVIWPFLAALAVAWVVVLTATSSHHPPEDRRTGIVVWIVTVVFGLLLRRVSGDGTAAAFIIVTTLFLGVTMLGWRSIRTMIER